MAIRGNAWDLGFPLFGVDICQGYQKCVHRSHEHPPSPDFHVGVREAPARELFLVGLV